MIVDRRIFSSSIGIEVKNAFGHLNFYFCILFSQQNPYEVVFYLVMGRNFIIFIILNLVDYLVASELPVLNFLLLLAMELAWIPCFHPFLVILLKLICLPILTTVFYLLLPGLKIFRSVVWYFLQFPFIGRFNATDFLERLRGKRLMLVGDSMNRNQFESLLCLLREGLTNKSRMYEIYGHKITKGRGYYVFTFLVIQTLFSLIASLD